MPSPLYKLTAFALASLLLAGCAAGPGAPGADAAPTPRSLESQKIWRAKPRTVLAAHLSSRLRQDALDNAQFLAISRRIFPAIQREFEAVATSGITPDPVQTEKVLTKYRTEFGALPDSVYELYSLQFGVAPVPSRFGGLPGSHAVYSAQEGGLVFNGHLGMDLAANDYPVPPNFTPAKDFIGRVEVKRRAMKVVVPMAEDAYKQEVYKATVAGRLYRPTFDLLVVYRPAPCTMESQQLSCQSQVVSSTVYRQDAAPTGNPIRNAAVRFE